MTLNIKEARARSDAATSGPWHYIGQGWIEDVRGIGGAPNPVISMTRTDADGVFAACARTDLPAALDVLDSLLELVQPIIERNEGRISTHSDKCYEYHVACLAVAIRHRIQPEPLDANTCADCGEGIHLDYAGSDMGVLEGASVWEHDRWRSSMVDPHEPRLTAEPGL